MKNTLLTGAFAVIALGMSFQAVAKPGASHIAPDSSVRHCVALISKQADYGNAGRVLHEVDSQERRVSGHKLIIDTTVFDADTGAAVREYATVCAVNDETETRGFKFRETSQ